MNKVICEICGTSYPDTAPECPICGYTQDMGAALREELETGEISAPQSVEAVKEPVSDIQEVLEETAEEVKSGDKTPEYDDSEYDDEPRGSNALLVMLLVVVITALLAVTAFIGIKYILPNVLPEETTMPTVVTQAPTTENTEVPNVPCTNLVLTSGATVHLEKEGQYWLLNVVILPVDSTDKLTYESSDENVATVSSEGRVTAVASGEAVITIRCGEQALECRIVCDIPEETTVPETSEDGEETDPSDELDEEEETEPSDEAGEGQEEEDNQENGEAEATDDTAENDEAESN